MTSARPRLLLTLCMILLLTGCGGRVLIPTPSVYETSSVPLFTDLAPTLQGNSVDVLYATDRLPEQPESGETFGYGSQRSTSVALGIARVAIESATWREYVAHRCCLLGHPEKMTKLRIQEPPGRGLR